jgi:hypothetical protein
MMRELRLARPHDNCVGTVASRLTGHCPSTPEAGQKGAVAWSGVKFPSWLPVRGGTRRESILECPPMSHSKISLCGFLTLVGLSLVGCLENSNKKKSAAASTGSSSNVAVAAKGDTGTVEGTVTMEGDSAAVQLDLAGRIPSDCVEATPTYSRVFREGAGRRVADVFVGVTGYRGTPGERRGEVTVGARGCAWDRRTYGMTPEQHLAIKSLDQRPYVPSLFGAKTGASLVAVPGGDAVPVYAKGPGMYVLVDEMRNFVQATVLVVKFPTFDVTGLDGKFHIDGVPVGTANVAAFLPTVNLNAAQDITVSKNTTTSVSLKLRFDAAAFATHAAADPAAISTPSALSPQPLPK